MDHAIPWTLVKSECICFHLIDGVLFLALFSRFKLLLMADSFTHVTCFHTNENITT